MIRGTQRKMIIVKTSDSTLFEEAYFVVRNGGVARGSDMMAEANRIIENCDDKRRERQKIMHKKILLPLGLFLGGSALGSVLTLLITLLS